MIYQSIFAWSAGRQGDWPAADMIYDFVLKRHVCGRVEPHQNNIIDA